MNKLFLFFLVGAGLLTSSIIYNSTISKLDTQEKFDGISKATKPKKTSRLFT